MIHPSHGHAAPRRLARVLAASVALLAGTAGATGTIDDFESYVIGGFPAPTWIDIASFDPRPDPPSSAPTARVDTTLDAAGNPTQAMQLLDELTLVSGIYQPVDRGTAYSLAADIRIDRYGNGATYPTLDFAIQLTFGQLDRNWYETPQSGVYASTATGGWRLFLTEDVNGIFADVDLGVAATPGVWYRVAYDLNATSGTWRVRLGDIAAGTTLLDTSGSFAGWGPGNGNYDAVAFFSGHAIGSPDVTIASLATVDNINVTAVPEPGSALLLMAGVALLGARRLRPTA